MKKFGEFVNSLGGKYITGGCWNVYKRYGIC